MTVERSNVHFPNRPIRALVARAQMTLGMSHAKFGETLGASQRTAARWAAGQSSVGVDGLRTLARLVHSRDAALAAELAAAASETLESLGIVAPRPPKMPAALAIDAIVCAAADAMDATPAKARAGIAAALKRARELNVDVAEIDAALAPLPARRAPPPRPSPGSGGG